MSSFLKLGKAMKGIKVIGGTPMPAFAPATIVAETQQAMVRKGILPQASSRPSDTAESSLELLGALNLSVDSTTDRTFSLLSTETDTEVIANPNIIDTIKWEETTNIPIVATTSFPSATDNFFTLDAGPDEAVLRQREQTEKKKNSKNLVGIANNLINYNLGDFTRPTLPQFKI